MYIVPHTIDNVHTETELLKARNLAAKSCNGELHHSAVFTQEGKSSEMFTTKHYTVCNFDNAVKISQSAQLGLIQNINRPEQENPHICQYRESIYVPIFTDP